MHYSDEQHVSELRRNNHAALRELYRMYYPMVLNLVSNNSGTEQEAKDVYQEAVIHFYERIQLAEFVLTCKIKTYLYAVCRRLWLKRLAEKKKNIRISGGEDFEGLDEVMIDMDETETNFQHMDRALGSLGEPCRTLVEDFYLRGHTMDAITKKFGYTNSDNAKNQKYKCLQRLKRIFFQGSKLNSPL